MPLNVEEKARDGEVVHTGNIHVQSSGILNPQCGVSPDKSSDTDLSSVRRMMGKCRLFSPLQHMTGGHTAPPTAEVPTGDTHGGTRTPAALVGALRVAGLILPLCGGETRVTLSVHVTGQHRPTAGELTAVGRRGVVAHADALLAGFEEAGPLVAPQVAQLGVVPYHHVSGTHLFQRAQAEPAQVLGPHHRQTVLTGETGGHVTRPTACGSVVTGEKSSVMMQEQ